MKDELNILNRENRPAVVEMEDELLDILLKYFAVIEEEYISLIIEQLKEFAGVIPTTKRRIEILVKMGTNINYIKRRIKSALNLTNKQLERILEAVAEDTLEEMRPPPRDRFKRVEGSGDGKEIDGIYPSTTLKKLNKLARLLAKQSNERMFNFSNTTAMGADYRKYIDMAIIALSSGLTDINKEIEKIVETAGKNGLRVTYESGHTRRLDSAVRMNLSDTINQMSILAELEAAEDLGYKYIELSAHPYCALDHEEIQGRVFSIEEFKKMQDGEPFKNYDGKSYAAIKRPIGQWNCRHTVRAFEPGVSVRRYPDEKLQQWKKKNHEGVEINGKHYTIYEVTQLMRQYETEMRRLEEKGMAFEKAGDLEGRKRVQRKLDDLEKSYLALARTANLKPKLDRTTVPGYNPVRL